MPSGRRDLAWLEKAREVRELLKAYWDSVRAYHRHHFERIQSSQENVEHILSLCSFDLAPEHLEALQLEEETILNQAQARPVSKAPLSETSLQTYWPPESFATTAPALPIREKEKVKTRGMPSEVEEVPEGPAPPPPPPTPQIAVRQESLKIFMDMYPPEKEKPSGKTVNWPKFVGAMADAGMIASQSGGLAVTFGNGQRQDHLSQAASGGKSESGDVVQHGQKAAQMVWLAQEHFCGGWDVIVDEFSFV